MHCQQRGHDREAGPDAGSAAVAAARTEHAERQRQRGARERGRRDRVEVHVRDGEGIVVVRQEERHHGRQPDDDAAPGRAEQACAVHARYIGQITSAL